MMAIDVYGDHWAWSRGSDWITLEDQVPSQLVSSRRTLCKRTMPNQCILLCGAVGRGILCPPQVEPYTNKGQTLTWHTASSTEQREQQHT